MSNTRGLLVRLPARGREGEGEEGVDRVLGCTAGARVSSAKGRADMGVMAHTGNKDCDMWFAASALLVSLLSPKPEGSVVRKTFLQLL